MPIRCVYSLIIILIFLALPVSASKEPVDTVRLFNRVSGLRLPEMLDLADSARKAGDNAKALSLYMAISGTGSDDADADYVRDSVRVKACLEAGNILAQKCNYAGALEYYINGLKISESLERHPLASTLYKNIGNIYTCVKDYEQGLNYYRKGLEECAVSPDPEQKRKLLTNLSVICMYLNRPQESLEYIKLAAMVPLPHDAELHYMTEQVEGTLHEHSGNYHEALKIFKDLDRFADVNYIEPRYRCSIWEHLFYIYDKLGQPDSALVYLKRCDEGVNANGLTAKYPDMLKAFSEFYAENGRPDLSRQYKLRYIDLRDSLGNERDFNAVKNIQFQYEAGKIAGKINDLHRRQAGHEATIRRQTAMLLGGFAGLLVLAGFMIVFYRQKKRISENYRDLYRIYRTFTQRMETLDKELKDCAGVIAARDAEIASLKAGAARAADDVPELRTAKYTSSNLNDSTRSSLAGRISDIMDGGTAFCDPAFSLDMLAELSGSNTKYVSQTINEAFHKNFSNYVNDYRVKLACSRLIDPAYANYTVKAIGESVGFGSQSSFTAVFRKYTGLTPSIYQKMSQSTGL